MRTKVFSQSFRRELPLLLLSAFLLMAAALYNRFPLINSDSGAYIDNGYKGFIVPFDRPVLYSWFVRHISLAHSLWFAIYAQCLLLAFVIIRVSRLLVPELSRKLCFVIIALLMAFSCIGWYSGQLMPDIFTAILALALLSFFLRPEMSWIDGVIILFAALVHNSNLISLSCACLLFVLLRIASGTRIEWKRILTGLGISGAAWLMIMSYHAALGYGFTASRGAPIFLVGKMCENGLLPKYLDEYCPTEHYRICEYRDQLPDAGWKFIWSDDGPVSKLGGREGNVDEYKAILRGMTHRPKYLGLQALKAVEATAMQLAQLDAGLSFIPLREGSAPHMIIKDYYNHELPAYMNSRQQSGDLRLERVDWTYACFLVLSSIAALLILSCRRGQDPIRAAYLVVILFIVCNAFSTGVFANVLSRLESRVVWTVSLLNLLLFARALLHIPAIRRYLGMAPAQVG